MKKYVQKFRQTLRHWPEDLKLLALLVVAAELLSVLRIGCPIRFLTGIPCPGCGMSRALIQLAQFHFKNALALHPMSLLMPFGFLAWLCREQIAPVWQKRILTTVLVMFTITYIIRLGAHDPVLNVNLQNGFLYRIICALLQFQ